MSAPTSIAEASERLVRQIVVLDIDPSPAHRDPGRDFMRACLVNALVKAAHQALEGKCPKGVKIEDHPKPRVN